ncbi:GntG family PLP-dependent aldolase [Acidaminobacter hydrogenoformans]|uniref:L-threonine aldolase n=1 Tax=Acidaminobacter hydrogenoformans DSM 2784 TaxID=1120920 RepID=A0A1G5RQK5_9FIRM|nr:GntG family PLP-dependent aldolase [Acidaminobacter hydrogenoformans]SCZ76372.1 L-threonine aldolase [Acidaminobacter hydrogenoformans DSM 2784]
MNNFIDLRSDTVTQPTKSMREAMYNADVGDDILGEDSTVKKLESMSAEILGKESALFVTSGTMGNQLAVMAMANRGEEVLIGDSSHIFNLEVGGLAALSQVQTRSFPIPEGVYDLNYLEEHIQPKAIQTPKTALICLENTNNLNAGMVVPQANLDHVYQLAKDKGIFVHMDGARIFNASVKTGIPVSRIVSGADTVMFALTKGLSAPFGAILAGNEETINKARWLKQRIGGGYRQAGFLAAPGIVALESMISRLEEDHENALYLGNELSKIEGLYVDTGRIHTNIVVASLKGLSLEIDQLIQDLLDVNIKVKKISKSSFRMVTHYGITRNEIQIASKSIRDIISNKIM